MKKILFTISLAVFVSMLGCRPQDPAEDAVLIVAGGEPLAEIVIAEEPSRMARLAARELRDHVELMSGAVLPIVSEPTGDRPVIYVGISRFTEKLGLEVDDLEHGAFRMDSGEGWLALLGREREHEPVEPWGRSRSSQEARRVVEEWAEITGEPFANPFATHFRHYYPDHETGIFDERDYVQEAFREVVETHYPDLGVWVFDEAGTLNAVHEWLRDLGIRWYAPGEIGLVIPERRTIEMPSVQRVVRPQYALRELHYGGTQHGVGDLGAWNLRLGFNPGGDLIGHVQACHGMRFVLELPEMHEAHPEFYALQEDGSRSTLAPCLSAEGLLEMHADYVRAMFDHFDEQVVNIDLPDGFGLGCHCESCRSQLTPDRGMDGTTSDLVFGYLDRLARKLYESHPDRMVVIHAYSSYRLPPLQIEQFSPNVALTWARSIRRRSMRLDEEGAREDAKEFQRDLEEWMEKIPSGQLVMWESLLEPRPRTRGLPAWYPRAIAADLRMLRDVSMGDIVETHRHQEFSNLRPHDHGQDYDAFAFNHLNIYVTSRLWWDPDLDLDALLDEYFDLYYGPASNQARALMEYCEPRWADLHQDAGAIGEVLARVQAMEAAVDPETVYGQRVARLVEFVRPLETLQKQLAQTRRENPLEHRALRADSLRGKTLDGRVDDPEFWPQARIRLMVDNISGTRPPEERDTRARIFYAGSSLYIGVYCAEPDMEQLRNRLTGADVIDTEVEDYIEMLFETNENTFYRVRVSPSGVLEEADLTDGGEELRWKSGGEAAVHLGEDYWSVEFRLPIGGPGIRLDDPLSGVEGRMPTAVHPWHFNIGRQRVDGSEVSRYGIVATGVPEFNVPHEFARMWSR
jgi:hypothetical protein